MKGPTGKMFDGIYNNPRFIHTAASLVGCLVQVKVKSGDTYEGIFHTFSENVDVVLEMVHKVDSKSTSGSGLSNETRINLDKVTEKMIFRVQDVVTMGCSNIDLQFATRDSFTDTAISKFNGQVQERELEPWDGGFSPNETLTELGTEAEVSNGWNADEMFKTNETKYGVKTSFDSSLQDYTIPLNKQNTEEYKLQEAKASEIAQEIESGCHYRSNLILENGDEEDQFSAVTRIPDAPSPPISAPVPNSNNNSLNVNNSTTNNNNNNGNRFMNHRMRKSPGMRSTTRSSPSPTTHPNNRMPHAHSQSFHKVSNPNSYPPNNSNNQGRMVNTKSFNRGIPSPTPRYSTNPSLPPLHRQTSNSPPQANVPNQGSSQFPPTMNQVPVSNTSTSPNCQYMEECKINGDVEKKGGRYAPDLRPPKSNNKESDNTDSAKDADRFKEPIDKKVASRKTQDENLKRFHETFKLSETKESKEMKEPQGPNKSSLQEAEITPAELKQSEAKPCNLDHKSQQSPADVIPDESKNSTLNPNAKEFILNPNAKSFTPKGMLVPTNMIPPPVPPPSIQPPPPRLQSPVIAVPQPHMMQHVFTNVTPHYVLQANPVSMPVASPYTPATSVAQAPRYRKAMPMTLPRNDSSQSIHVQAATGQPILAPPTLSTPQYTIQYATPGMMHPQGPQQTQIAYPMYSMVGPRVISPQPVGMLSAGGSYGDNSHVPAHYFMNPAAVAAVQHQGNSNPNQQQSNPSTPQSQTPNLHPTPSPVHQQPSINAPHSQPPTPTGHPSNPPTPQLLFQGQHPLHINPASSSHPGYPTMYGNPQPIMLLSQHTMPGGHHPAAFTAIQNHFHAQAAAGAHSGQQTQLIQHPHMAMIQTSTAITHAQVAASNNHYASHSQV